MKIENILKNKSGRHLCFEHDLESCIDCESKVKDFLKNYDIEVINTSRIPDRHSMAYVVAELTANYFTHSFDSGNYSIWFRGKK